MKEKLSDFDAAEVKELINNDIDDFVRYLNKKKQLIPKK
jgi:hypothetical protein